VKQLDIILGQIKKIDAIVLPKIKSDVGYSFTNRDLVLTALVQPSVKKIFSEIKKSSIRHQILSFRNKLLICLRAALIEPTHLHGLVTSL